MPREGVVHVTLSIPRSGWNLWYRKGRMRTKGHEAASQGKDQRRAPPVAKPVSARGKVSRRRRTSC